MLRSWLPTVGGGYSCGNKRSKQVNVTRKTVATS